VDAETKRAFRVVRDALWYVNPSGNPLYERGLKRVLEPLEKILAEEHKGTDPAPRPRAHLP